MTEAEASLRELLVRSGRGDQEAFGRFYDATVRIVYGMAMSVGGDPATAEALTAEVYVAAWKVAPGFAANTVGPGAWLAGIARAKIGVAERQGRRGRGVTRRSPRFARVEA
jgi:RNA polymerase sigma-70 factor (ECF subfamily)